MKRAAEAQAGRPFVDKRRKPWPPPNEDEQVILFIRLKKPSILILNAL